MKQHRNPMALQRNWVLLLIGFIVCTGFLVNYLDRVPKRHYCDYRVYYKAGQDILKGKNIYIRESEGVTPFKYSPFFAFAFVPLSLLPIKASAAVFFIIDFVLTCLFFKLCFELIQGSGIAVSLSTRDCCLIYGLTVLCSIRYILLVWDSGQVSILMGVLVMAALNFVARDKQLLAGVCLAASILVKYTPALFLPYLLLQRKFKAVGWSLLFIVVFLLLPAILVGIEKNALYLSSWVPSIISTSLDKFSYMDSKNQSIFSVFVRFLSPTYFNVQVLSLSFDQALFAGRIAALLLYLPVFISGKNQGQLAINGAILLICMSLFNPNGWLLNFVSLVLSYMLLIHHLWVTRAKDKIIVIALVFAFIATNFMSKDFLGKAAEDLGCAYSFTAFGALAIYAALLKLKFSSE